ncbi:Aste57867_11902 [Aphanomyces stellatus]|uniref:Aste57867_11902 protein n=1 Tax=Aphanomyces stellatus TaxID=120398 RepID=A0A485KVE0_9STRA|nr:hypothetical protein As57867_011857 [Aphanomyces stellatus]VFT88757.1 Aste57867_11902 [Aphanomyces stellatus]
MPPPTATDATASPPTLPKSHITTLLWKNFLLKKKHPVKWALEMVVPVLFILLLGGLKKLTDDVKVPDGWSDTTTSVDVNTGTSHNLFEQVRLPIGLAFPSLPATNATLNVSTFFATETTMSSYLLNLAMQAFLGGKNLQELSQSDLLQCARFAVEGKVSLDPTSPNAVPPECRGKVVPYKLAIVPDTPFTRNYFAVVVGSWYPRVPLTPPSILATPTIPSFSDSIVFYPDEASLEAYIQSTTYGADLSTPVIQAAIVFDRVPDPIGTVGSIEYSLRLNSTLGRQGIPGDVPTTNLKAFNALQKNIDLTYFQKYTTFGFLTLQTLVTRFVTCVPDWNTQTQTTSSTCTQAQSTAPASAASDSRLLKQVQADSTMQTAAQFFNILPLPSKVNLTNLPVATQAALVRPLRQAPQSYYGSPIFPFPIQAYVSSPFYAQVQSFFSIVFIISYLFSISSILVALITEKENKSRELMKILGVQDNSIIWSWYITYGAIFVVSALLQAAASSKDLFPNCSALLVFIFFLLFGWSVLAYGFLVSSIFSKSRLGTYIGIVAFFVMYLITSGFDTTSSEASKTAVCLFAPVAMSFGVQTMAAAEASSLGITLGNMNESYGNFRFATALAFLLFDTIWYTLLGLYLERVVPKDYGVPEPWYFPVSRQYWRKVLGYDRRVQDKVASPPTDLESSRETIEPVGPELRQQEETGDALQIINLRKEFRVPGGIKVSVKGMNLTMYKNQITCLLGHNGAGKTTLISMLTGMIPATSGDATIHGLSLKQDLSEIRHSLGMCPQHDVLYAELTVQEHLLFYARIKGFRGAALMAEVESKISEVGLTEKRQARSSDLSGGMKRKLSLAIALLGDSRVVFLDEPTSGMDPYSRRSSWEIIQNNRYNRIIVLTTHFMDEADILGDRIAIMAEGELRCCGSTLFLKNRYGAGYNFSLVKTDECDTAALISFVNGHVPTAKVLSNVGTEVSFQLPLDCSHLFAAMFADLDVNLAPFGVLSYGISVTTLEEVFIKVAEVGDEHHQHTLGTNPVRKEDKGYKIDATTPRASRLVMFGIHFVALFKKRVRTAKRDRKIVLFGALLPIAFIVLGITILKVFSLAKNDKSLRLGLGNYSTPATPVTPVPIYCVADAAWCTSLQQTYRGGQLALLPTTTFDSSTPTVFKTLYANPPIQPNDTTGVCLQTGEQLWTRGIGQSTLGQYGAYVVHGSSATGEFGYAIAINTTAPHASANYKAMMDQAVYAMVTNSPTATLVVNSHPLPLTAKSKVLFTTFISFATAICVVLAFCFFSASIVPYIVSEKHPTHNSKHQQLVSGVSLPAFWLANFAWDMCLFSVPCVFALIVIYAFDITPFTGNSCDTCAGTPFAAVAVLLVLMGLSLISFCYCLSYLFLDSSSSQTFTIMINVVLGVVLMTVSVVLDVVPSTTELNKSLKFVWRLSPLFNVGNGLNSLAIFTIRATFGRDGYTRGLSAFDTKVVGWEVTYLAVESIVFPVIAIGIDYLLSFPKIKAAVMKDPNVVDAPYDVDVDVQAEETRIANGAADRDAIVMKNLRKVYKGGKVGIIQMSLALPKGECFGYLGINGAGKTSTMKILTGDVLPSRGTAQLGGLDILSHQIEVRRLIGYCPQFDALIDLLTVREHLELFAAIKGVPTEHINQTVVDKMEQMNLNDFEHKLAGTLSGGNKRKLSVAIAMIGSPPIIFLDEPSTGMDPVSRRFMWDVIADISTRSKESTILLTTHSMEECEALCTRVGIMVGGRLRCVGSIQHLKHRFGDGLVMHVKLAAIKSDEVASMVASTMADTTTVTKDNLEATCLRLGKMQRAKDIDGNHPTGYVLADSLERHKSISAKDFCTWWLSEDRFEGFSTYLTSSFAAQKGSAELLERQNDQSRFKLVSPNLMLSAVFALVEGCKAELHVEEYTVAQTTLEQIFNNFASQQTQERGVARGVVVRNMEAPQASTVDDHYVAAP